MPYPEQIELLRDLVVNDHTKIDDEPLLLAVYYASATAPEEENLFEVADNFGYGEPSEDKHIFQIQFGPSPNFPLPTEDRLRLSLTSPVEFRLAVQEGWPEVKDLQDAIARGQYTRLYPQQDADNGAADLWMLLERHTAMA